MALKLLRRLTSCELNRTVRNPEPYPSIQDPQICRQLRKGNFVIILNKAIYYDGEYVHGKIYCDRRKFYEQKQVSEVTLSFEIMEYFQMVSYHQDNCWSWGELNTLSKKEVPLWRARTVLTLAELCLIKILQTYKDQEIKQLNLPFELRERLSLFTWGFTTKVPFGYPPSLKLKGGNPGSPTFDYVLQVTLTDTEHVKKPLVEKKITVANWIPSIPSPQPISSHSHANLLALTTYVEGQVLYPGSEITINVRETLENLGSFLKVKFMQKIVIKRHKNIPRDCTVNPIVLQEAKIPIRNLEEQIHSDGSKSYNFNFKINPDKDFLPSYKRYKGSIRIMHSIKTKSANRKLGEIIVTLSHSPPSSELEAELGPRRPAKYTRNIHSIVEARYYHQKWDWIF